MSSSLLKMRESMKSKTSMFKSSSGKQVEALRDNLQQVGAQKALHEQQAEMWKQKYAAVIKLVQHLELLIEQQVERSVACAPLSPLPSAVHKKHTQSQGGKADYRKSAPSDDARKRSELHKLATKCTGAADPDHVPGMGTEIPAGPGRGLTEEKLFEYVVLLGVPEQDVQNAVLSCGLAPLQQGLLLDSKKLASFPEEPTLESLEDFCFPMRVPASLVTDSDQTPLAQSLDLDDAVDVDLRGLGLTRFKP
jgi:hypothetical protein